MHFHAIPIRCQGRGCGGSDGHDRADEAVPSEVVDSGDDPTTDEREGIERRGFVGGVEVPVDEAVEAAAAWVAEARSIVALTGAGISTDSGIPDFRGRNGVWTRNPEAEKASTIEHYMSSTEVRARAWQMRRSLAGLVGPSPTPVTTRWSSSSGAVGSTPSSPRTPTASTCSPGRRPSGWSRSTGRCAG